MGVLKFPSLTILEAVTSSNIIGGYLFDYIDSLEIFAPAALAGVVTVEVADTEPGAAVDADFRTQQSGGADVTVTVDDATPITSINFRSLRLTTTVAPGVGGEVFAVVANERCFSFR